MSSALYIFTTPLEKISQPRVSCATWPAQLVEMCTCNIYQYIMYFV